MSKNVIEFDVQTVQEADLAAFGQSAVDALTGGYTSHFNFDNRAFPTDTNPPTTNKYRCQVQCKLVNGQMKWYTTQDLATVRVGELSLLDINAKRVQVAQCRFWWKLSPGGQLFSSDWVKADPDNHIVYAFLVWHGRNDYDKPILLYQESNN